jgi:hypothetical protein
MKRKSQFSKNLALEDLLKKLNELLAGVQEKVCRQYTAPVFPPVFIVGCARSGTTLLIQWLAGSGCFTYPSNFISRFYGSPNIGGLIQQMLFDSRFAFNEEMSGLNLKPEDWFKSDLGKTNGLLAPNEFWYFWRRFFDYGDIQFLDDTKLKQIDTRTLLSELAALEDVFKLPLLMKALIVNWNLKFIADQIKNAIFLYIKRNSFFNIQSLLEARKKYFEDIQKWYSFKPLEYTTLKDKDPVSQVVGQVYYTNKAVRKGLSAINESRWLEIKYEDLCYSPRTVWENMSVLMRNNGYQLDPKYDGPVQFECMNKSKITDSEKEEICLKYNRLVHADN